MRSAVFCCLYVLLLAGCAMSAVADQARVQPAALPITNASSQPSQSSEIAPQVTPVIVTPNPPATCPVTRPQEPLFAPPSPYQTPAPWPGIFWYGTDSLWTTIPDSGVWSDLPHNPEGYTQKIMWWRKGYSWQDEPEPALSVTARRLDGPAPTPNISRATNAFAEDIQSAMLVGADFPTLGCWEISGQYAGDKLSFVIWIAP